MDSIDLENKILEGLLDLALIAAPPVPIKHGVDSLMRDNRVYVKDDSVTRQQGNVPAGFRAVEVETGISSDDYVQITSGLSEGDEVYVDSSSNTSTDMFQMGGMGGPDGGMGCGPGGGNGGQGGNGGNRGGGNGGNRGGGGMP